mgnify:CR=1 FL=1
MATATGRAGHETGAEMLAMARAGRPNVRYALNAKGNAIGGWSEAHGRFVTVACLTLLGMWVTMPYELLINGKPIENTWNE